MSGPLLHIEQQPPTAAAADRDVRNPQSIATLQLPRADARIPARSNTIDVTSVPSPEDLWPHPAFRSPHYRDLIIYSTDWTPIMTTVFLVDDHEIVRRGLIDMLEDDPELTIVGEAGDVAHALARIPALRPDVAVLDIRLPDGNGVELCRELLSRVEGLHCLILTSFTDQQAMLDAVLAGASGYVIKDIKGMELAAAIKTVGSGRSLLDHRAATALMDRLRHSTRADGPLADLTNQERTLLDLLGEGLTNRQIAERMFLAEKTVKNYVSRLLAKLGLERRTQAAVYISKIQAGQNR